MNLSSRLLTGAALLLALPAAMAASTIDVTVAGSIVPSACTPTLSTGTFNHGRISKTDLNSDKHTSFYSKQIMGKLFINCAAPTVYAIKGIDNRADSVARHSNVVAPYGLGYTPAKEKIGAHYLEISTPGSTLDGGAALFMTAASVGAAWGAPVSYELNIRNDGRLIGLAKTAGTSGGPSAVGSAILTLGSSIEIAPAKGLTLTDEVALDGAATIEVVYL
ncbi:hypothetical protein ASF66_13800 [Pseudomonas sp. Leaf129]|jgi:hypothetical protein|uniref:DUF1120 domain-containing protein n=1 Tax=Pseudomonas sp. Leaf129 TaxID=1736268 RepID=UPI0007035D2D|nr:DUF1120 domain-containing protein [Pseudomonas sp. Leaf129]KQQ60807.1 hypothetical protein ASF66_13800 [Pseudomonas sp. Leaf129]